MPYIDLIHSDDCASIWFETSSNLGNVNSFDPQKPTVAMLHPMFLSSEWFRNQMDDFRLKSAFNMVAFDTRTSGKSVSKPSGLYDASVQAADLAYCLQVRFRHPHPSRAPLTSASIYISQLYTSSLPRPYLSIVHYVSHPCTFHNQLGAPILTPTPQVSRNGSKFDARQRPPANRV